VSIDHDFMREAMLEADRASEQGEVPVGCVRVHDGNIISRGHNLREGSQDPTTHAEMIAIREAARVLGSWRLLDVVVYVTLEPCLMCLGALVQARIARLIFAATDPKVGAVRLLRRKGVSQGLNHRFPVVRGVLADEAAVLVRAFFAKRR